MFQKVVGQMAGRYPVRNWGERGLRRGRRSEAFLCDADWRTLGVIGAGRHTGVTHLAVWLGNYLAGVRREKTALLEWNCHGDFRNIEQFCAADAGCSSIRQPFRILEVDYYANAGVKELAGCMNRDYRRIVIDFGEITGESICECARCDRKVIVGAFSEWQAEAFLELVREKAGRDKSWSYTAAFGSEETRRESRKAFGVDILRVPLSADAFAVTRSDMSFFAKLLREQA